MALTDQPYGDREAALNQERGAPMSQQNNIHPMPVPGGNSPAAQGAPSQVVPFDAPTQRPNEPITTGVDIGPGAGSEVLGLPASPATGSNGSMTTLLRTLSSTDATGVLAQLYQAAAARNA